MPYVSVIMPVRDGGRHLGAAIQSILRQSYTDFEFVVVDDGSQDGTLDLITSYASQDSRLKVVGQKRVGIVGALRAGLARSSGELIARMDADDVSAEQRLERQVAEMTARPHIAVVGSSCIVIDDVGRQTGRMEMPTSSDQIHKRLPTENCIAHPTVMIRRSVLDEIGGYRSQFAHCEDYDLWLRIAERYPLANLPEPLLLYRMHADQCTWRGHEQRFLSELGAQACARLRRSGVSEPPLPADGLVDISFLERAGISRRNIVDEIVYRALGAAEDALRRTFTRSAWSALQVALRQDISLGRRANLATRFVRLWLATHLRRTRALQ